MKYLRAPDAVAAATTYKIMYASRSIADRPIVVTGVAVVPDASASANSRVVLTTGHGTTGLADRCAPSLSPPAGLGGVGAAAVANNWIVAATDYEGLGTPGPHPYLVGESEGRSVLDAALAAAQLPAANASNRVLIAGYSQGGHAALWANQIANTWTPSLKVLGTFAGAPVTEIDRILQNARTSPTRTLVVAIVAGYRAAYPTADPTRFLTDEGVARLAVTDQGCLPEIHEATRSIDSAALVRATGPTDRQWLGLARRNNPGTGGSAGPVLIVHSNQDDVIPAELSAVLHDRMCARGEVVERRVGSFGSHERAALTAARVALTWLTQRVKDTPVVNDCVPRA